MATKKKTAKRKKTGSKKATAGTTKRNRLGVKNSLVNNINARKKKGISRSKKKKTVDKESYEQMEKDWQ